MFKRAFARPKFLISFFQCFLSFQLYNEFVLFLNFCPPFKILNAALTVSERERERVICINIVTQLSIKSTSQTGLISVSIVI